MVARIEIVSSNSVVYNVDLSMVNWIEYWDELSIVIFNFRSGQRLKVEIPDNEYKHRKQIIHNYYKNLNNAN